MSVVSSHCRSLPIRLRPAWCSCWHPLCRKACLRLWPNKTLKGLDVQPPITQRQRVGPRVKLSSSRGLRDPGEHMYNRAIKRTAHVGIYTSGQCCLHMIYTGLLRFTTRCMCMYLPRLIFACKPPQDIWRCCKTVTCPCESFLCKPPHVVSGAMHR